MKDKNYEILSNRHIKDFLFLHLQFNFKTKRITEGIIYMFFG